MIQILPKKPQFGERFVETFQPSFQKSLERFLGEESERKKQERLFEHQLGIVRAKEKAKKDAQYIKDEEAEQVMAKYFGPDIAKFWAIQTPQGRGSIVAKLLDLKERDIDVHNFLEEYKAKGGQIFDEKEEEEILPASPIKSEPIKEKITGVEETLTPKGEQVDVEEEDIGEAPIQYPTKGIVPKEKIQIQTKQAQDAMKRESEKAAPFLKRMSEIRQNAHIKKNSLTQMRNAILSGGNMTKDVIADRFNLPWLRTDEGAQLKLSTKEFILGNIPRVGARPNQWIEQQISQMAPQVGQRPSANLKMVAGLNFEADVEEKLAEVANDLEQKYLKKWGYVPGNIDAIVNEKVRPYVEERQKELAYQLAQITEDYQSPKEFEEIKTVIEGTPLTLRKASYLKEKIRELRPKDSEQEINKKTAQLARKLGYEIPSKSIVSKVSR